MNRKPSFGLLSLAKSTSQPDKSFSTEPSPFNGPKSAREAGTADKSGWRKKFHTGRPKTPLPVNVAVDELKVPDDVARRPQAETSGWKKNKQTSRAGTPVPAGASISVEEDVDDSRSEPGTEPVTLHRRSDPPRPSSKRHWSSYIAITAPKEQFFSEPWSSDLPSVLSPTVDPLIVLQSVRSHIYNVPTAPIPVQHHSGILRVFEDYRKAREEKETLERLLRNTVEDFGRAEGSWTTSEEQYKAEIRRLELLIARGTSGMAGLVRARQGSIVKHTRRHTAHASNASQTIPEFSGQGQFQQSLGLSRKQFSPHRSSSPSGTMASLSKKFASSSLEQLPFGTPPSSERKMTLSRKVKSELNLSKMTQVGTINSESLSTYSDFSASGDPLPDERAMVTTQPLQLSHGHEKVIELHNLLSRAALKRGIDTETLPSDLLAMLPEASQMKPIDDTAHFANQDNDLMVVHRRDNDATRPSLHSVAMGYRHFSFESGDDQLTEKNLRNLHKIACPDTIPRARLPQFVDSSSDSLSDGSAGIFHDIEPGKLSKIPSPVRGLLPVHREREVSASSLQTVVGRPALEDDRRRDSRSSVLTAFRHASQNSVTPGSSSTSRSTSNNNLSEVDGQMLKGSLVTHPLRNNVAAVAAARAVRKASNASSSKNTTIPRPTRPTSSADGSQRHRSRAQSSSENEAPQRSS